MDAKTLSSALARSDAQVEVLNCVVAALLAEMSIRTGTPIPAIHSSATASLERIARARPQTDVTLEVETHYQMALDAICSRAQKQIDDAQKHPRPG